MMCHCPPNISNGGLVTVHVDNVLATHGHTIVIDVRSSNKFIPGANNFSHGAINFYWHILKYGVESTYAFGLLKQKKSFSNYSVDNPLTNTRRSSYRRTALNS